MARRNIFGAVARCCAAQSYFAASAASRRIRIRDIGDATEAMTASGGRI